MFALKDLMGRLGVTSLDCRQDGAALDPSLGRASYLFNATVAGIEQADALMIVGANPRKEAPVLNARIRKRWRAGKFPIALIGERADLTYDYNYLGAGPETLGNLKGDEFGKAERPLWLIGQGALTRPTAPPCWRWPPRPRRPPARSRTAGTGSPSCTRRRRVSARSTSASCRRQGASRPPRWRRPARSTWCSCSAPTRSTSQPGAFVVYIGTHGDRGAHRADVILPGAAYTEKSGIYVNTEGRVQMAARAGFPPGDAREDWAILRALSDLLGQKLPYDSLAGLRAALFAAFPHLARVDQIAAGDPAAVTNLAARGGTPDKAPFRSAVTDFYLTNPVARASAIMGECSALARGQQALTAAE